MLTEKRGRFIWIEMTLFFKNSKKFCLIFWAVFLVWNIPLIAQKNEKEALQVEIEKLPETNILVDKLNKLAGLLSSEDPKKAVLYAERTEKLSQTLDYPLGLAEAKTILGKINAYSLDKPEKAALYHEQAYFILRNLYENGEIDKWKILKFIESEVNPVYQYLYERSSKKKKEKKAIQKYLALHADLNEYLTQLANTTQETLSNVKTELDESKVESEKNKKELSVKASELEKKKITEKRLILEKLSLSGNLQKKELEAIALADSLMLIDLQLKNKALMLMQQKNKSQKLEQEKLVRESLINRQRDFVFYLSMVIFLVAALVILVLIGYLNSQKKNRILLIQRNELSIKNQEINQQKEEISAQRDNLEQLNIELEQQKEEIATQRDSIEHQNSVLQQQMEEIQSQREYLSQLNKAISLQRDKSDQLLLNILPVEIAMELKEHGKATPQYYEMATVIFTDFKGFTQIATELTPERIITELNECFLAFDEIIDRHNLEKIKTIGDAYMCAGGLPVPNKSNPLDAVKAALEMQKFMQKWQQEKKAKGEPIWELRLGIHTGPLVAGVIGKNKFAYDIWGDTVNLASRLETAGEVGKVNISGVTYRYVKDHFNCTYRGKILVKNKGEVDMYFVEEKLTFFQKIRMMAGTA